MSTIWWVQEPDIGEFAVSLFLWESYATHSKCDTCGRDQHDRLPLVLEWEPGPGRRLGDFMWPNSSRAVVTGDVAGELEGVVSGFELGSVRFVNEPRVQGRRGARAREIEGLDSSTTFHELWVTTEVGMDRERSTGAPDPDRSCEVCGLERWQMRGVETVDWNYDSQRKELVFTRNERVSQAGVFVDESLLGGPSFFFVKELSGWLFCTDEVKVMAERLGWTNIEFLEFGETFKP